MAEKINPNFTVFIKINRRIDIILQSLIQSRGIIEKCVFAV